MPAPDWRDALLFEPVGAHSDGLVISSAQTLTPPAGATKIMIQSLTQNARITFDGTAPTASSGFQLRTTNSPIIFMLGPDTVIKVIQETATADLQYQWGR